MLEKVDKIIAAGKISLLFGDASKEAGNIQQRKEAIFGSIGKAEPDENLTHSLAVSLNKPHEMIVLLSEAPDKGRVYILDEEDPAV